MSFKCNQSQLPLGEHKDPRKGGFNTGIHIVRECSESEDIHTVVYMSQLANAKKDEMMMAYPQREWLAYLIGKKQGNDWEVQDLVVPAQITTAGSVEVDPNVDRPANCIGTIHSHGASEHSTGFSSVDEDFLVKNYFVSIVTTGQPMTASVKVVLPCGQYGISKATVLLVQKKFDLSNWIKKAIENIKHPAPIPIQPALPAMQDSSIVYCEMCKAEVPLEKADFIYTEGHIRYFCEKCSGYLYNT